MIKTFDSTVNMPAVPLPVRSTLVFDHGRGILFSPIGFDEAQIREIKSAGPVTDIVAPCLFHHLFVPRAHRAFPDAKLWGTLGFEKKRPDIAWTEFLTEQNWPYKNFLDVVQLEGTPRTNELVFLHKESKTLIAMDLCFNLQNPKGRLAWLFFSLFGTYKKFAISRLVKLAVKDKQAFTNSLKRILEWDFDKIIMAHGEIVQTDGKRMLKSALKERGFDV